MRSACVMTSAGISLAALCVWVGASLYGANAAPEAGNAEAALSMAPSMVDRTHRSDRIKPSVVSVGDLAGAIDTGFASVEVAGQLASAIVIRDQYGRLLYSMDPATQTTVIAKRPMTYGRSLPPKNRETADRKSSPSPSVELPDGCEGAFSPYAAPKMAHVIGRCISAIPGSVQVASAGR